MPSDSVNAHMPSAAATSLGRSNFVALAGQDSPERQDMLSKSSQGSTKRSWRSFASASWTRTASSECALSRRGCSPRPHGTECRSPPRLFAMDSANNIFQNVFARDGGFGRDTMGGGGDMLAMPDLATFRVLPWAHKCGWVLSDLYLKSGERCPFDPRLIMQTACDRLAKQGLTYVVGVSKSNATS